MSSRVEVGVVIRRTFEIYVDQAPVLMPAAAVVFVISSLLSVVLLAASPALAIVGLVISIVATTLFTGMVVELVADVQDGRRDASVSQLLRAASPMLGPLLLVGILAGLGIVIGLVLFVIPGVILMTIWSVAAPVVVLERLSATRALGRSRELVKGNGWRVFGVIVVMVVLVGILGGGVELAAQAAGTLAGLGARVIVGVLSAPLSSLAAAVLYFQLRGERSEQAIAGAVPL